MAKDYYAILGIPQDATQAQIKAAYRRQAKKLHPDACGGDRERFQDVQEAYEVLSDAAQRRAYDRRTARRPSPRSVPLWRRVESLRSRHTLPHPVEPLAPEPLLPREQRFAREQPFVPEPLIAPASPFSPEPLIPQKPLRSRESLFPLAHSPEALGEARAPVGSDQVEQLYAEIPLTPYQAERGGRVEIWVPMQIACPECLGWGGWGAGVCPRCAGRGRIAGERPLLLSFPGGIVNGQVSRVSLEQAGLPGVALMVRFVVER